MATQSLATTAPREFCGGATTRRAPRPHRHRCPVSCFANGSSNRSSSASTTGSTTRRARVQQRIEAVDATLRRLEEQEPLATWPGSPVGGGDEPEATLPEARCAWPRSSGVVVATTLRQQQQQQQQAAAEVLQLVQQQAVALPRQLVAAKVCTGKKCSQAGAAAVMQQLAVVPGVAAQPAKCMGQCKRCVAVQFAGSGGADAALYSGVSPANASAVLAAYQQQQQRTQHQSRA